MADNKTDIPDPDATPPARSTPPKAESTNDRLYAERVAALTTLASGVAHEVNNPLSFLRSNLEFIRQELERLAGLLAPERKAELISAIVEAIEGADRISAAVGSVRLFAQTDRGAVGPCSLKRVAEAAIKIAWPQIGRRARLLQTLDTVPEVIANEPRLAQVILKLLVNAGEAFPPSRGPDQNTVSVRTSFLAATNEVALDVEDNGNGMMPHEAARAFDANAAINLPGEGVLGLPLCYRLVTSMGGQMSLQTAVGKGSVVRVTLPSVSSAVWPS